MFPVVFRGLAEPVPVWSSPQESPKPFCRKGPEAQRGLGVLRQTVWPIPPTTVPWERVGNALPRHADYTAEWIGLDRSTTNSTETHPNVFEKHDSLETLLGYNDFR